MKICKYELDEEKPIKVPLAEVLDVRQEGDRFVLLALVKPNSDRMKRVYTKVLGTGDEIRSVEYREMSYRKTIGERHVFLRIE